MHALLLASTFEHSLRGLKRLMLGTRMGHG